MYTSGRMWHISMLTFELTFRTNFLENIMTITTQTLRASAFALLATVLMACQGETNAQSIDETKYQPVSKQITITSGDKIEVAELFWFGCPHCYSLEPALKKWKKTKPANVKFKKVPAIFSARWEFHAKAFYTMEALDVPEEAYENFFRALHVERRQISNLSQLSAHLKPYDKTEEQVEASFNSFEVDSNLRAAKKITQQSGAKGVPALIVDGKYLTSETISGGTQQMFSIVDQLVGKAAAER